MPRIVSFLPAATEMVYALGLGDQLVGISHECDFPAEARTKPVVVRPALALEEMSLLEIDVAVAERIRSGGSLYEVNEDLLCELKPDLILTQDLCQVCAPSGNDLASALKLLQPTPEILWMSPHSLGEIFENIRELGRATDRSSAAESCCAPSNCWDRRSCTCRATSTKKSGSTARISGRCESTSCRLPRAWRRNKCAARASLTGSVPCRRANAGLSISPCERKKICAPKATAKADDGQWWCTPVITRPRLRFGVSAAFRSGDDRSRV